jgi:hypothetical protein
LEERHVHTVEVMGSRPVSPTSTAVEAAYCAEAVPRGRVPRPAIANLYLGRQGYTFAVAIVWGRLMYGMFGKHGIGGWIKRVAPNRTVDDLLRDADLDFHVGLVFLMACMPEDRSVVDAELQPLFFHKMAGPMPADEAELPSRLRLVSGSYVGVVATEPNGRRFPICIAGSKYTVLQNRTFVGDALDLGRRWGSALTGLGRRGAVIAGEFEPVPRPIQLMDGEFVDFPLRLFTLSSHDLSYAYTIGFYVSEPDEVDPIGWAMLKRKHSKNVGDGSKVQELLEEIKSESDKFIADLQHLARCGLDAKSLKSLLEAMPTDLVIGDADNFRVQLEDGLKLRADRYGYSGLALLLSWLALLRPSKEEMSGASVLEQIIGHVVGKRGARAEARAWMSGRLRA